MNVESDRADCVVAIEFLRFGGTSYGCFGALVVFETAERIVGKTGGLSLLRLLQTLALSLENEFGVFDE